MVKKKINVKLSYFNDLILLDTGSTLKETITNPKLITNIRMSCNPVLMMTNTGIKQLTLEVTVKGLGHAWYDSTQGANIFFLIFEIKIKNHL